MRIDNSLDYNVQLFIFDLLSPHLSHQMFLVRLHDREHLQPNPLLDHFLVFYEQFHVTWSALFLGFKFLEFHLEPLIYQFLGFSDPVLPILI